MPASQDEHMKDAAVLSRAVENVFRRLIRFLVGRISLVKLQEMMRYIYVEEAENKLQTEKPERNTSLTQLALLCGLDTRTLIKIRNSAGYRRPFHTKSSFLKEFNPGAAIIDVWASKAPFVDPESGLPRDLTVSGERESFEALFHEAIRSRGVTPQSLLDRLIECGSVVANEENGRVKLVRRSYLPSQSGDQLGSIEMGFSAIGNLIETVVHNVESLVTGEDRLYQRGAWTYRLSPRNKDALRDELRKLLSDTDDRAREIISGFEEDNSQADSLTAGVSLFYFEE